MIDLNVFLPVSIRGRMAYALLCAEKYMLACFPERDWRPLLRKLWDATSREDIYNWLDYERILPSDFLYESQKFGYEEAYSYLFVEEYDYFVALYEGMKTEERGKGLIRLFDFLFEVFGRPMYSIVYPDDGFEELKTICRILEQEGIPLPDPQMVAFSQFPENNGWGERFDGTKLSLLLNPPKNVG